MAQRTTASADTDALKQAVTPVEAEDTMAEAGRKILLADFVKLLQHEAGSRSGEDSEDVHDMRVATRRMRSALKLLQDYFKVRPIRAYSEALKDLARVLGNVRDLDVMIANLKQYRSSLTDEWQAAFEPVIAGVEKKRAKAHKKLVAYLDGDHYATFISDFGDFVMQPGKWARPVNAEEATPYQVRHVLPSLVHERLANVRAYDNVIDTADTRTLHALRIEFKRLRYVIAYFSDVLGNSGTDFVESLKAIQDHLGNLNDVVVAQEAMQALVEDEDFDHTTSEIVYEYCNVLAQRQADLQGLFPDVWTRFNTRAVQRKLSDALLMLR
ncbi:MAG: CHAD domain-containing protein [bacterium]|nr:CHAD domain-containing protein [bacterium]